MNIKSSIIILSATVLALSACGSKKTAVSGTGTGVATTKTSTDASRTRIDFLDKVNENASYQKNIVASITFTASQDGGKEISVPGQLRMRKDEVVRLSVQVPVLGTEVGRMEFTKDYVLIVDRMHKEYVKTSYDKVAFLRDNGINFYTLQSLFWNKLYLPGKSTVGYTDLEKFKVDLNAAGSTVPIKIGSGKLNYEWAADRSSGLINEAKVDYSSKGNGKSTLKWDYSDFRNFGSKKFPFKNVLTISTPATGKEKTLKATFSFSNISTSADWEAETTVSSKYKEVSADDILGKLK